MQEIKTIHTSDESDFENMVNAWLEEGWRISSTNCGFVNSERYDFCCSYQAILIRDVETKASSRMSDGTTYNSSGEIIPGSSMINGGNQYATGGMINGGGPGGEMPISINIDVKHARSPEDIEKIVDKIQDGLARRAKINGPIIR